MQKKHNLKQKKDLLKEQPESAEALENSLDVHALSEKDLAGVAGGKHEAGKPEPLYNQKTTPVNSTYTC